MSHEWNCTCVRCERERDWLDAVDDEPEPREPPRAREASEGEE
jgi:hypothetical protein